MNKEFEALESLEIFKVHYEEVNNQWYLQIHFNNDELRVIQLPLLPYEANDIDLLLQNKKNTIKQALQRLDKYEQILGSGRLTDRNYKNTTLDLDSCKPYLKLGQLEDIYEVKNNE